MYITQNILIYREKNLSKNFVSFITSITFGRLESLLCRKESKENYSHSLVWLVSMAFLKECPFHPRMEWTFHPFLDGITIHSMKECIYTKLSLNFFKKLKLIFHLKNKNIVS